MSERIQKFLARAGFGSRREIDKWVAEGKVSHDGGVYSLGDKVDVDDIVIVDGRRVRVSEEETNTRVIAYHKKSGEISTHRDPGNRPLVVDSLPPISSGRWILVGRLDINTTGLILFTNNGDLANALMHPSSQVEREYLCRVLGKVSEKEISQLKEGVTSRNELLRFNSVDYVEGEGANQWYRIILTQGKNREIHRAWEAVGHKVSRLKRIRYGPVSLARGLKQGEWKELNQQQIKGLKQCTDSIRQ